MFSNPSLSRQSRLSFIPLGETLSISKISYEVCAMRSHVQVCFLCCFAVFCLLGVPSQGQGVQQVVQGMQARWANIYDASAVIEIQTWKKNEGEKVNVFYGQIFYRAPLLVRLEYSPAPESASGTAKIYPLGENKYIYIHDGRKLWRYSPSQKSWVDQYGSDPVIAMVNQIADINNFNVDRFLSIYPASRCQIRQFSGHPDIPYPSGTQGTWRPTPAPDDVDPPADLSPSRGHYGPRG